MEETIRIKIGEEVLNVPGRVVNMSQYLHNILSLGLETFAASEGEEQAQVHLDVPLPYFKHFLEFCELNNYTHPQVPTPIKSNDISQYLSPANLAFIRKFPTMSEDYKQLARLATFLACKGLITVCAVPVACTIYFDDTREAFERKCQELGIKETIEFDDEEKFKKLYPFLNN